MSQLDQFASAFCGWGLSRQVTFLRDAGDFLAHVGRFDLDENERLTVLKVADVSLQPLFLSNRLQPGKLIADALQAAADVNASCVERAYCQLLAQPLDYVDAESLTEILGVLVEMEFNAGERIASEAITRLTRMPTRFPSLERYAAATVYIVGLAAGGRASVAAVERLRKLGFGSLALAEAALRMVASSEPSALQFALKTLEQDLESSDETSQDGLAELVRELVDRSDDLSVLMALAGLDPAGHPRLFKASIVSDPDAGPFALFRIITPFSSGHRLVVITATGRFEIDDLVKGVPGQTAEWKSVLVKTLGLKLPTILDAAGTSTEYPRDDRPPMPQTRAFAEQFGFSHLRFHS